jgi:hypothetical protein
MRRPLPKWEVLGHCYGVLWEVGVQEVKVEDKDNAEDVGGHRSPIYLPKRSNRADTLKIATKYAPTGLTKEAQQSGYTQNSDKICLPWSCQRGPTERIHAK